MFRSCLFGITALTWGPSRPDRMIVVAGPARDRNRAIDACAPGIDSSL